MAQKLEVPVSGIGPLLVLKLNAFDDRQQPKDAYDVMLGVTRYVEGPEAAIAAFHAEANASNRGFARAAAALRKHFLETGQSGPVRCAAFALEGQAGTDDFQSRQRQISGTDGNCGACSTGNALSYLVGYIATRRPWEMKMAS